MNQSTLALTFEKVVEGFLLNLHANGYSKATIDIYQWGLAKFATYFPAHIHEVRKEHLLATFSGLRDAGLKPASIQNVWIAMRKFFSWANKELCIERVDESIPCPKASPPLVVPFTADEIKRLLSACKYSKNAVNVVIFFISTYI